MDASNSITTDDVTPLTIFTVWDTLLYVKETELGGRSKSLIFSLLKNSQNRSSQKDISRGFMLGFFVLISGLIYSRSDLKTQIISILVHSLETFIQKFSSKAE